MPDEPERFNDRHKKPVATDSVQTAEQAVLADYLASLHGPGRPLSQRFLAEKHGVDRRRVRKIISTVEQ